jgi:hypothetical protein
VTGAGAGLLEVRARARSAEAEMGDALPAPADTVVQFRVQVSGMRGAMLRVTDNGRQIQPLRDAAIAGDNAQLAFDYASDGKPHWIRADVVNTEGKLLLLGNPVYLNR